MRTRSLVATVLLSLIMIAPNLAVAQGTAATDPKLPPVIEAAFKKAYPKAIIKRVFQQKYGGKDAFEIESTDAGKTRDVVYHLDGAVAVVSEEIAVADVPTPVRTAVKKDYPKGAIVRYKRKLESGATSYEVELKGVKDETSAEYSPDGKRK